MRCLEPKTTSQNKTYELHNFEDQQKARRWKIYTKIEWNLPDLLHTVEWTALSLSPSGKKKGTEEIRSDIYFHEFSSNAEQLEEMTSNAFINALRCFTVTSQTNNS